MRSSAPGVGDLVDAAAHEQVAGERPRGGMLDHLVDLELVVPRAGLEEEVVREILDQVAGGEHVVAVPGTALRVLRQRRPAAWLNGPLPRSVLKIPFGHALIEIS